MKWLVSGCLLGIACRHDGESSPSPHVMALIGRHDLYPICPEQLGGLPTPRPPCEIAGGRVFSHDGEERTEAFLRGAGEAMRLYRLLGCEGAILKARSPSCGPGQVYDGTFSGVLTCGHGFFAGMLSGESIPMLTEEDIPALEALLMDTTP